MSQGSPIARREVERERLHGEVYSAATHAMDFLYELIARYPGYDPLADLRLDKLRVRSAVATASRALLALDGPELDSELATQIAAATKDLDLLAEQLNRPCPVDLNLPQAFHLDNGRDSVAMLATALVDLQQFLAEVTEPQIPDAVPRVGRVAGRLAEWAVRLMPVAERPRYGEEMRGELAEIAKTGRCRDQLGYAFQRLAFAMPLRRELRRGSPMPARDRQW